MNNTNIQWENHKAPATDEMIANVERVLGIRYPEDYLAVARLAHGASPATGSHFSYVDPKLGRVGTALGVLLSFDSESVDGVLRMHEAHVREGTMPALIVPFGEDGGGDMMAFDFRQDPTNPPVVYVSHEGGNGVVFDNVYPLAASFTEFLGMLTED